MSIEVSDNLLELAEVLAAIMGVSVEEALPLAQDLFEFDYEEEEGTLDAGA